MCSHSSSESPVFESPPPTPPPPPPNAEEQSAPNPADEQPGSAVEVGRPAEGDGAENGAICQTVTEVVAECFVSEMSGDVSGPEDDALLPISNVTAPSPARPSHNQLCSQHNVLAFSSQIFSPAEYLSSFNILRLSFHKFDSLHLLPPLVCHLMLTQTRTVWW